MDAAGDIVDVLVIGAGASGGALTWSLSQAGIKVMCLEQGGWTDPKDYPPLMDDWELHRQAEANASPNVRKLPQDYPVNDSDSPIEPLMYNAVGGSTIHWGAHFPRLLPSDFRVRTLDGVADDWPLSYGELEPFYDLNDRMIGVAGAAGDTAYPPKPPRQTPPIPLGRLGEAMVRGFETMGWHWWPSDSAIITRPYRGRPACNNCGPCELGCPTGARAGADITYWPEALKSGAVLKTDARVREITVDKSGLATGAIYYDADGVAHQQQARIVVMAANGIGTPRLLLNSRSSLFPDGLANGSGMVGRNLMFHNHVELAGVFEEELDSYKGPYSCSVVSHQFYETDPSRGFTRGYTFQIARSGGPAEIAMGFSGTNQVPWGQHHHEALAERLGHAVTVAVSGEDLPEPHNRVTLDPQLTDSDGIPAPRISYTLSENSRKILDHGIASGTELLKAAGAKEVLATPLLSTGYHLMGTAGMGADPAGSVVDGHGRCHDVKNLFIVDGSVFVTSGAVNPTSTIQALALYIAYYIKANARHILD